MNSENDRVWSFGAGSQTPVEHKWPTYSAENAVRKRQLADNIILCWAFLEDKRDSLPVAIYEIYRRQVRRICLQNRDAILIDDCPELQRA